MTSFIRKFEVMLACLSSYMCVYEWQACKRCHAECRTCIGQGLSFCESCVHFEQDGRCVAKCSSDYYVDAAAAMYGAVGGAAKCKRCNPRCLTCTGPTASDCLTCVEYKVYYDFAHGHSNMRVCGISRVNNRTNKCTLEKTWARDNFKRCLW